MFGQELKRENRRLKQRNEELLQALREADARLAEHRTFTDRLIEDNQKAHARVIRAQNHYAGWFVELAHEVFNWSNRNWPRRKSKDVVCSMTEEIGELMRAESKGEQGIRGTPEHWEAEAKREWGDVLIAALDYALVRGWNPIDVLQERWDDVKNRDWQKFPKNGRTE